jgi:CO/xanthine dehydrogenase FAD-binding subunit
VNPTILAGGTDLHPRWEREVIQWPTTILDIKAIEELNGIALANGEVSIGACTLMSELEVDPIVRGSAPLLAEAAARLACPQIRNRATVGGNLCNASPAADTAVPLILLDAVLELASVHGGQVAKREVPIAEFFRGPGATTLAAGEILTRIRFNALPDDWFWAWDKFGTRPAMEIAVASVGLVLACEGGVVTHVRVGYGSVAPVPMRGRQAEAELVGNPISERVIKACVTAARKEIAPIRDVRATAAYRREIVGVMLTRMLNDAHRARED